LGLLDPATEFGLPPVKEDFGQTLSIYGVGEGFYWMAPILGPSSPRDLAGRVVDGLTNPLSYVGGGNATTITSVSTKVTDIVEYRAQSLETLDALERGSTDFYASIRSAYRQKRNIEILNDKGGVSAFQDLEE
jgi:phospholipid-binding lipoprotein MlaA